MRRVAIAGAGGQAREVASLIRALAARGEDLHCAGYILGSMADAEPGATDILGDEAWLRANRHAVDALALGIGTPAGRLRITAKLLADFPEELWPPLLHPTSILDRANCFIGAGAMVGAGAILTVNVTLEPFAMANFGCTLGHEVRVGRGSVINPGANLSGGVVIGEGVLIGTGAQVLQYRTVGDGAVVGAGAVVTRDVPPGATVVGIPAKEQRNG